MRYGVTGSPAGSGPACLGSNPGTAASLTPARLAGRVRPEHDVKRHLPPRTAAASPSYGGRPGSAPGGGSYQAASAAWITVRVAEWQTRQLEVLVPATGAAGSSPAADT